MKPILTILENMNLLTEHQFSMIMIPDHSLNKALLWDSITAYL